MTGRRSQSKELEEKDRKAQVSVAVKGNPEEVSEAMKNMQGSSDFPKKDENENQDELIQELLADPQNKIIVKRIFPRKFEGQNCAREVGEFECPVDMNDIRNEIFETCGGKKFRVSIHPATPTGRNKILNAFMIENPDQDEPILADEDDEMTEIDPYSFPDDDPERATEELLKRRVKYLQSKMQMTQLQETIDELDGKKKPKGERDDKKEDDRFAKLEHQMMVDQLKRGFESQIADLRRTIEDSAKPKTDPMLSMILAKMMEQNATLLTAIVSNKSHGIDDDLERFGKIANIMNVGQSRSGIIEGALEDVLLSKLRGDKSGDDEDPMMFAIRELVPVLKDIATKEKSKSGDDLTKEEKEKIYKEAGRKAAEELAMKMQEQRRLQLENAQRQISETQAGGTSSSVPIPKVVPPAADPVLNPTPDRFQDEEPETEMPGPEPLIQVPDQGNGDPLALAPNEEESEGEEMEDLPAAPGKEGYDRKISVNFVLDSLIQEIEDGIPFQEGSESEAVADFLDLLDNELLDEIANITQEEELEILVKEWGEIEKIETLRKMGDQNQIIKIYLRRVLVTVQEEHVREMMQKANTLQK